VTGDEVFGIAELDMCPDGQSKQAEYIETIARLNTGTQTDQRLQSHSYPLIPQNDMEWRSPQVPGITAFGIDLGLFVPTLFHTVIAFSVDQKMLLIRLTIPIKSCLIRKDSVSALGNRDI
jgi:hypothetical protein